MQQKKQTQKFDVTLSSTTTAGSHLTAPTRKIMVIVGDRQPEFVQGTIWGISPEVGSLQVYNGDEKVAEFSSPMGYTVKFADPR